MTAIAAAPQPCEQVALLAAQQPLAEFGVLLQRSKNGGVANALPLVKAEGPMYKGTVSISPFM